MAKGCMAVPWGHLLDGSMLFSFRGFGFKANDGYQKFMFYVTCQSFLWSIKQISVIKREFRFCSQSPCF